MIINKYIFLISLLCMGLLLISQASAITCPENTYSIGIGETCIYRNSPFIIKGDFCAYPACIAADYPYCSGDGFYFIEGGASPTNVTIFYANLPLEGNYTLNITYKRGSPGQTDENFTIECGSKSYYFPDNPSILNGFYSTNITCDLKSGPNNITIRPIGRHSTHIHTFNLETCISSSSAPSSVLPFFTSNNFILSLVLIFFIYLLFFFNNPKDKP